MTKELNTDHLVRCIQALTYALKHLQSAIPTSIEYEVFRSAVIKEFELTLETAGKLLRRVLKNYTGDPRTIDALTYKQVLRHATKHALIDTVAIKRWFEYRDNRNNTAYDYGIAFAEETLILLPQFLIDASALQTILQKKFSEK